MPDDRRRSPGRRESDRILDALWRELDAVERSRERDRTDLRLELARLETSVGKLEAHFEQRVDDLEEFHITERTRIGLQLSEHDLARQNRRDRLAERLGRWAVGGYVVGAIGVVWGIVVTVTHL